MSELTGKERVARQLKHLPVDRIAAMEQFWTHTISHWVEQGTFPPGESPEDHFNLDIAMNWTFNLKIKSILFAILYCKRRNKALVYFYEIIVGLIN